MDSMVVSRSAWVCVSKTSKSGSKRHGGWGEEGGRWEDAGTGGTGALGGGGVVNALDTPGARAG